jgi:hypothetical protein
MIAKLRIEISSWGRSYPSGIARPSLVFLRKIRIHNAFKAEFLINLDVLDSNLPSLRLLTMVSLLTITSPSVV